MPYLENHLLYYKKSCPYCQKVGGCPWMQVAYEEQLAAKRANVIEQLVRIGGKKQVPCLVVNGKPLYESDDIIAYLRTHA
mgnify:CR=1 FL=1